NIKTKLEEHKGDWPEVLPEVLWAYRTTQRTTTGESPFSLAYGYEAMIPVESGTGSLRRSVYEQNQNDVLLRIELDLLEERREQSQLRIASYQQCTARHYNSKVRSRHFEVGDLVLRRVLPNNKEHGAGIFAPSWEGPYVIDNVIRPGTYNLASIGGQKIEHAWNVEQLRRYYQ
ncbi:Ribonuclease H-like domain containing protein, partial [Parasponia andersonii]